MFSKQSWHWRETGATPHPDFRDASNPLPIGTRDNDSGLLLKYSFQLQSDSLDYLTIGSGGLEAMLGSLSEVIQPQQG
jgi:hypothetical protein